MKKGQLFLLVLAFLFIGLLSFILQNGSWEDRKHCSKEGEICVHLDIASSFTTGDPVDLLITVTSSKDFPDLHLVMQFNGEITVEDVVTWEEENLRNQTISNGDAYWNFEIKAGETLTFRRVLHFPARKQGYLDVYVTVVNPGRIITARNDISIVLTKDGGLVFMDGTRVPKYTPNVTSPAYGPGTPAPTFITNPTSSWREPSLPPPASEGAPTIYPVPPYQPPSSPSPTPTNFSYP